MAVSDLTQSCANCLQYQRQLYYNIKSTALLACIELLELKECICGNKYVYPLTYEYSADRYCNSGYKQQKLMGVFSH